MIPPSPYTSYPSGFCFSSKIHLLFNLSTSIIPAQATIAAYLDYWRKKKIPTCLSSSILPSVPAQSIPLTSTSPKPRLRNIQWFLISLRIKSKLMTMIQKLSLHCLILHSPHPPFLAFFCPSNVQALSSSRSFHMLFSSLAVLFCPFF